MTETRKEGKKHYRCHAHTNPFRDNLEIPADPTQVNWEEHFGDGSAPVNVDIGCGYGRFLFHLAEVFPNKNSCGLELRDKVAEYVKIRTERMCNCTVIKTNALFFLPNYFEKGSLERIFILFPDPHFKKRKQKGRLVSQQTVPVFRYLLVQDGLVYISTDVQSLFTDMCTVFEESGCFEHAPDVDGTPLFEKAHRDTDEAHRAGVKSGHTFCRVFRSI